MAEFHYKLSSFVELNCGCLIHDDSGELYEECISHVQAQFIQ